MITSTEASGHVGRRNRLRRRNEASPTAENYGIHLTQIDNEDESTLALDLLHHDESRELQQHQGPPARPELSVRSNGNKIDASASFHQGGRRSIQIFDQDCTTASPLQFTVDGSAMGSASSYTYYAPTQPADSTVDFEISLVGISSLKDHPNDDVVICISLETVNTLQRTLLTVDVDLYKEYTLGVNAKQSVADESTSTVEDAATASSATSTAEESGRLVGRFRKSDIFSRRRPLLRQGRRGGQ